jgi:hypothetical protein
MRTHIHTHTHTYTHTHTHIHIPQKGACVRAVSKRGATAISMLQAAGATPAQIAYLRARQCCANPGCVGDRVKGCAVCKETRHCGVVCRFEHWGRWSRL